MKTKRKTPTITNVERNVTTLANRRDIAIPPRAVPRMKGPVTRRFWAWPNHLNEGRIIYLDHKRISKGRERVALVRIRNPAFVIAKAAKGLRRYVATPLQEDAARAVLEALGVLWRPRPQDMRRKVAAMRKKLKPRGGIAVNWTAPAKDVKSVRIYRTKKKARK